MRIQFKKSQSHVGYLCALEGWEAFGNRPHAGSWPKHCRAIASPIAAIPLAVTPTRAPETFAALQTYSQ